MTKIAIALGNRLINEREKLGISQEELAFKCNISATHMGQLERGITSPTLETLQKLADGIGITILQLLDFSSDLPASKLDSKTNKIVALIQNRTDEEKTKIHKVIKAMLNQ